MSIVVVDTSRLKYALPSWIGSLTFMPVPTTLCPMKTAVYLTKAEAIREARLNQPRVTSEQALAQRELLRRASEEFFEDARRATSSRGHAKTPA